MATKHFRGIFFRQYETSMKKKSNFHTFTFLLFLQKGYETCGSLYRMFQKEYHTVNNFVVNIDWKNNFKSNRFFFRIS